MNAGELCEFAHCMGWIKKAIPDLSRRVAPLRELLKKAYKKLGKRTKRSITTIPLSNLGWNSEHEAVFKILQQTLCEHIMLAHQKPNHALCIYTNASDRFWTSVITQCDQAELDKLCSEQSHEPLAFLLGVLTGAELG